ncbi:MAG: helix-turn-helix transcriptional regulator [Clostridia bacterium]|nr:helix-turn-helix transcriptional regulator [Clostridia bacterium]
MILYDPFYKTIKEKGISTYKLINQYGISRSLLDRLKHNKPLSTSTLNELCKILSCKIEDIVVYVDDEVCL